MNGPVPRTSFAVCLKACVSDHCSYLVLRPSYFVLNSPLRLVQIRIQRRVVVHLELAIGFVALAAGEEVVGKLLGGAGEVVVLGEGDGELAGDAFTVLGRGIGPVALLDEVV